MKPYFKTLFPEIASDRKIVRVEGENLWEDSLGKSVP
jgi:hypothetical protein